MVDQEGAIKALLKRLGDLLQRRHGSAVVSYANGDNDIETYACGKNP